jgi:glutamyl-tRNA reductase
LGIGELRTGEDAFLHLSRVGAGLDSSQVGEAEVFAQFRQAVRRFREVAEHDSSLAPILAASVGVSRAARRSLREIPIGSLASAAAEAVRSADRVAILGAGAMARSVSQLLNGNDVSVFARRPDPVAGLSTRPWSDLVNVIREFPAVISTVPGAPGIAPFDYLFASSAGSAWFPLIVDMGMPPAFSQGHQSQGGRYLGIDELAAAIEDRLEPEAEAVAEEEARATWSRLSSPRQAGDIIQAIVEEAERAVDEEVLRFASRLGAASEPETLLRQAAHNVARRVLHPVISYVGGSQLGQAELNLVTEAFGLDRE